MSPYPRIVFNSWIYGTYSTDTDTFKIWRTSGLGSPTAAWERVAENSLGDPVNHQSVALMVVYNNRILAGINTLKGTFGIPAHYGTGVEMWESSSGNPGSWSQVNSDGFGGLFSGCDGAACNFAIHQVIGSAATFKPAGAVKEYLYVGEYFLIMGRKYSVTMAAAYLAG